VLDFCGGEHFSERISDHVSGRAVNQPEGPLLNDPANEVVADVDMFGPHEILVILRESNR
jgi:hypothetical protein